MIGRNQLADGVGQTTCMSVHKVGPPHTVAPCAGVEQLSATAVPHIHSHTAPTHDAPVSVLADAARPGQGTSAGSAGTGSA